MYSEQLKSRAIELIKEAKMQNEFISTEIVERIKAEFNKTPSAQTIRNWARGVAVDIKEVEDKTKTTVVDKDGNEVTNIQGKIKTAEELCEERGINLDKWRINKIVVGEHSVGVKDEFQEDLKIMQLPNMKVTLKRWHIEEDKEAALKTIKNLGDKKQFESKEYSINNKDRFALFNAADLHLGKIAYEHISGDNYNIDIARNRLKNKLDETINELLHYGGMPGKIGLVIGNDGLNIDSPKNTTTSGTPQDVDGMYGHAKTMLTQLRFEVIETLVQHAPIKVVNVKGNHDEYSSIDIASTLRAYYYSNPNVDFNQDKSFKENPMVNSRAWQHIKFGDTLLVFNHGQKYTSNAKRKNIPNEVKTRYGDLMDNNTKTYVILGHLHKRMKYVEKRVDQQYGVTMLWMPSLCGTDKRHNEAGYIGNDKILETLIFDKEKGQKGSVLA